jgi:hypothetical protein
MAVVERRESTDIWIEHHDHTVKFVVYDHGIRILEYIRIPQPFWTFLMMMVRRFAP